MGLDWQVEVEAEKNADTGQEGVCGNNRHNDISGRNTYIHYPYCGDSLTVHTYVNICHCLNMCTLIAWWKYFKKLV